MNRLRLFPALIALVSGLWLAGCASSPTAPRLAAGQQPRHQNVRYETSGTVGYQLFLPQVYCAGDARRWPLIVFLHGAGERGTNLDLVTVHGPPKIVKSRPDFPFIVASPQCPPDVLWDVRLLDAWLDQLVAQLPVDPKRIYLTGLSMGGNGTWAWATERPERFAAAAPICGWADPVRVWIASGPRKDALKRLPVWAFHGAKDNVVPLSGSQTMGDAFARIGNPIKLTVYPDAGHDAWTTTYANQELYDWFLSHTLP